MLISLPLIDTFGEVESLTSEPVRAAGWYGSTQGLHTVSIRVLNFQGRISIQGTLAVAPTDDDWFSVMPDNVPYYQYPTSSVIVDVAYTGETSMKGFNYNGNIVWMRAVIDRSYLGHNFFTPCQYGMLGTVDSILLNYWRS